MRNPLRSGLATRLNLVMLIIVVLAVGATNFSIYLISAGAAKSALQKRGEILVSTLAANAEYALFTRDPHALTQLVELLSRDDAFEYAEVIDPEGRSLAFSRTEAHETHASSSEGLDLTDTHGIRIREDTRGVVDYLVAVHAGAGAFRLENDPLPSAADEVIGFVRIGVHQHLFSQILEKAIRTTLLSSLLILAVALVLAMWFTGRITSPLRRLTLAARQVASGKLEMELPVKAGGELGELARSFSYMVDGLRESQARVIDYQKLLEERVRSRTEELQHATHKVEQLAHHDHLTGLVNRVAMANRLTQLLREAERRAFRVGILFLDLDKFKRINDTLGHAAGDQVLQQAAERLRMCVRASDLVARFGGDEFVILASLENADFAVEQLGERILNAFETPFLVAGQTFHLGINVGVALYPRDGTEAGNLLKHADMALYAAKEEGRGGLCFFVPEMRQRIVDRITLEEGLQRALANHEFVLEYQPQLDIQTGALVGAEALIRWEDPVRGRIPPGDFIPLAESSGMIVDIGRWALREACHQAAVWRRTDSGVARIAVNISARQFEQADFVELVAEVLRETGLPPAALELELTESVFVSNTDDALESMRRIKALGVQLALDDFGTGYSSLAYLSRMPIDVIKIDRSFVQSALNDDSARSIVRAILALAWGLERRTIAEGVETFEQFEMLREAGCHEIQGFWLSRPCSSQALEAFAVGRRAEQSPGT